MQYRKRPVTIEAIQWTGLNLTEIKKFMGVETVPYSAQTDSFIIHTLEGDHEASKGDFVVRGVDGEFYPCKPTIFAKTYEQYDEANDSYIPVILK